MMTLQNTVIALKLLACRNVCNGMSNLLAKYSETSGTPNIAYSKMTEKV